MDAESHTDRKCAAHDDKNHGGGRGDDQGVAQIELFDPAGLAADEDDIHSESELRGRHCVIGSRWLGKKRA